MQFLGWNIASQKQLWIWEMQENKSSELWFFKLVILTQFTWALYSLGSFSCPSQDPTDSVSGNYHCVWSAGPIQWQREASCSFFKLHRIHRFCKCFAHRAVINIAIKQRSSVKQPSATEMHPVLSPPPLLGALLRAFSEPSLNKGIGALCFSLYNTALWKPGGFHLSDMLGANKRSQPS